MRNNPVRYDCRFGQPHDLRIISENRQVKCEQCAICGKRYRWNKIYRERIDNRGYVEAHIRQFAQKFGATKRIYNKLYNPSKTIIKI